MSAPSPRQSPSRLRTTDRLIHLIGNTPLLRLDTLAEEGSAEVWVKCEQYNPGGSVKDRVALALIDSGEQAGVIRPGVSTIVEPTSGNTGIGLALVCAARGYSLILTMPESMSLERRALLQSYGAKIVLTPAEQVMEAAVERSMALCRENDNYWMPDQFKNPANPDIHRQTTAQEILQQLRSATTDGRVDAFVSAIGTGGTVTGVGSTLRSVFPECKVIGVEPATSAVLSGKPAGPHKIQGIGAGFVPEILDRDVMTEVRTVEDREAYHMSKRLGREAGLLVGISAGANLVIALRVAAEIGPGKRVVTVLCDTGERYFSLDEYFQ